MLAVAKERRLLFCVLLQPVSEVLITNARRVNNCDLWFDIRGDIQAAKQVKDINSGAASTVWVAMANRFCGRQSALEEPQPN